MDNEQPSSRDSEEGLFHMQEDKEVEKPDWKNFVAIGGLSLSLVLWIAFWIYAQPKNPSTEIMALLVIGFLVVLISLLNWIASVVFYYQPQTRRSLSKCMNGVCLPLRSLDCSLDSLTNRLSSSSIAVTKKRLWSFLCIGEVILLFILVNFLFSFFPVGWGAFGDLLLAIVGTVSFAFLVGYLLRTVILLFAAIQHLCKPFASDAPQPAVTVFFGALLSCGLLMLLFSIFVGSGFIIGIVFAASHALFFLFSFFIGYFFLQKGASKPSKRFLVVSAVCVMAALTLNIFFYVWFALPGTALQYSPSAVGDVSPLQAPDPSLHGAFAVKTLTYGSGRDLRVEYGEDVAFKTPTVNISLFVSFDAYRSWFFGFDETEVPLNAKVWYPDIPLGTTRLPLFVMVHGNHQFSSAYSETGELMASRGFIAVSIDENFLNIGGFFAGAGPSKYANRQYDAMNDRESKDWVARAWLLLQHLKQWQQWTEDSSHMFYNAVDMQRVALMGHSRGGEVIAIAAVLKDLLALPEDSRVTLPDLRNISITSLIAVAPTNDAYYPGGKPIELKDVNYLILQGTYDQAELTMHGVARYTHLTVSPDSPYIKSALYIHRANHVQFNSNWGRYDVEFAKWFFNSEPVMTAEEQRKIAQVYVSAFLECSTNNHSEYLPLFRNHKSGLQWLPSTLYFNLYQDSNFLAIANFEEDIITTSTSIPGGNITVSNLSYWGESYITLYQTTMVLLKWEGTPVPGPQGIFSLSLPQNFSSEYNLTSSSLITFTCAIMYATGNDIQMETVLKFSDGTEETTSIDIHSFPTVQAFKNNGGNEIPTTARIGMQYFEVSLPTSSSFASLSSIDFTFEGSDSAFFLFDDIGVSL